MIPGADDEMTMVAIAPVAAPYWLRTMAEYTPAWFCAKAARGKLAFVAPGKFNELLDRGLAEFGGAPQRNPVLSVKLKCEQAGCFHGSVCWIQSSGAYEIHRQLNLYRLHIFRIPYESAVQLVTFISVRAIGAPPQGEILYTGGRAGTLESDDGR